MKRFQVALHRTMVDIETAHVVVEAGDADEARRLALAAYEDDPETTWTSTGRGLRTSTRKPARWRSCRGEQ